MPLTTLVERERLAVKLNTQWQTSIRQQQHCTRYLAARHMFFSPRDPIMPPASFSAPIVTTAIVGEPLLYSCTLQILTIITSPRAPEMGS